MALTFNSLPKYISITNLQELHSIPIDLFEVWEEMVEGVLLWGADSGDVLQ